MRGLQNVSGKMELKFFLGAGVWCGSDVIGTMLPCLDSSPTSVLHSSLLLTGNLGGSGSRPPTRETRIEFLAPGFGLELLQALGGVNWYVGDLCFVSLSLYLCLSGK